MDIDNDRFRLVGDVPPNIMRQMEKNARHAELYSMSPEKIRQVMEKSTAESTSMPYIAPGCKFNDLVIIVLDHNYNKEVYFSSNFLQRIFDVSNRNEEAFQYWIDRCEDVQSENNINKTVIEGLTKQLKENAEKIEMLSGALARSKEKESKLLKRLRKCQNK